MPVRVEGLSGVEQLSVGNSHQCAVLGDRSVMCWGANRMGQLGDGTNTRRDVPTPVRGLSGVVEVSAGAAHTCARTDKGQVWCWGDGSHGQLGDGNDGRGHRSLVPVLVKGLNGVEEVDVSGLEGVPVAAEAAFHTHRSCARKADGSVWCWGSNWGCQLGDGSQDNRSRPVRVHGVAGAAQVSMSATKTCIGDRQGRVTCWGFTLHKDKHRIDDKTTKWLWQCKPPRRVPGVKDAATLTSGAFHSCALGKSGTVTCWGSGAHGQLGDAVHPQTEVLAPVSIPAPTDVVHIGAGLFHNVAVTADGQIWCWGGCGYPPRPKPVPLHTLE
ncbi:MAG: RCC1 domain-containing protein [Myxococcota bacterium]